MAFLTDSELRKMGFKHIGQNVKISDKAVFYNPSEISIGDHSRIDDFCLISAGSDGIHIGRFIHIAAYCSIQGQGKVSLADYSGLSSRVAIYSSSDDYSGEFMTNPCVDSTFTNVQSGPVTLHEHVIIGVNSCILPNVTIGLGSAVGAFSLVSKDIPEHVIAVGVPAKVKVERHKKLLEVQLAFEKFAKIQ